jgi:hypothetical protein
MIGGIWGASEDVMPSVCFVGDASKRMRGRGKDMTYSRILDSEGCAII